jgi:L-iditol 2-dehydrogenase
MKTASIINSRKITIREVVKPAISSDTDVLLKIITVGICGSDIHYFLNGRIGDQVIDYPYTPGHECVAVVEKTGPKVTRLKPRDRVAVDPAVSCGRCDQCLRGRPHTCRKLSFLGCPNQLEGCLSEYIVIPEQNCYPFDKSMTFTQGVLVEPLSIGIYAVNHLKDIKADKIGILGTGPIGLSVLLAAQKTDIPAIYITDKIQSRIEAALNAGAKWGGNPDESDIVGAIKNQTSGLDVVFECCGDQAALDQAVELLRPGGKLLILGIPGIDRISFNISRLRRKEISILNIRRQNQCFQTALDMIKNGSVEVDFMATHTFPLIEAQNAFELASSYEDGVIKAIISP